jgi:hypothetical protein
MPAVVKLLEPPVIKVVRVAAAHQRWGKPVRILVLDMNIQEMGGAESRTHIVRVPSFIMAEVVQVVVTLIAPVMEQLVVMVVVVLPIIALLMLMEFPVQEVGAQEAHS